MEKQARVGENPARVAAYQKLKNSLTFPDIGKPCLGTRLIEKGQWKK